MYGRRKGKRGERLSPSKLRKCWRRDAEQACNGCIIPQALARTKSDNVVLKKHEFLSKVDVVVVLVERQNPRFA